MRIIKRVYIIFVITFLSAGYALTAQKTVYGVVTDSLGNGIENAMVHIEDDTNYVQTNYLGEYTMEVPDSSRTLVFKYEYVGMKQQIGDRTVINVALPIALAKKKLLSMHPRLDYPLGLQLTLAGHSLFAVSMNYFFNDKQSFEIGFCGRGPLLGARRYFPLKSAGNNKALYTGLLFNLPLDSGFVLYAPFGYHIMSHNGMTFSLEVAARSPDTPNQSLEVYDFFGFGINFGFQF